MLRKKQQDTFGEINRDDGVNFRGKISYVGDRWVRVETDTTIIEIPIDRIAAVIFNKDDLPPEKNCDRGMPW